MAQKSKDETFFKVLNAALKLELVKGHLKWNFSELSRESDVTRSLIYYYFGKEKEGLLKEAYQYVSSLIYGIEKVDDQDAFAPENNLNQEERFLHVLKEMKKMPYLFNLFCHERPSSSEFGLAIKKAEVSQIEKTLKNNPGFSRVDALRYYILQLGCIAYGQLSEEETLELFSGLKNKN